MGTKAKEETIKALKALAADESLFFFNPFSGDEFIFSHDSERYLLLAVHDDEETDDVTVECKPYTLYTLRYLSGSDLNPRTLQRMLEYARERSLVSEN